MACFPGGPSPRPSKPPVLTHHPRTGLPFIVNIPPKYDKTFRNDNKQQLEGRAVHFLADVQKINRHWNENKRILMITDKTICLCMTSDGMVARCVRIKDIREVILQSSEQQMHDDPHKQERRIALKITDNAGADGMYDLLFEVTDLADKPRILEILQKIYPDVTGEPMKGVQGRQLKIRQLDGKVGEPMEEAIHLKKPREWQNKLDPITLISKIAEEEGQRQKTLQGSDRALSSASDYDRQRALDEQRQREEEMLYQQQQTDFQRERDRALVQQEFQRIRAGLREHLEGFTQDEFAEMTRELEMYLGQMEERDSEIESLKEQIQTLIDNPEFWKNCPLCPEFGWSRESAVPTAATLRRRELEKKVEDYQQLIQHLQLTRSGNAAGGGLTESMQVAQMRQRLDEQQEKIRRLQKLIVDHPYPTEDVRLKAEQIAQGDEPHVSDTPQLRDLHERSDRLERELVQKDRSLRHQRNVMHDAFRRQVHELHRVRHQFQEYDRQIVNYLEKVFSANAFPQGGLAHGRSARQLAEEAAQAARQAATPGAFPNHTVGVSMPESGIDPLHLRDGTRRAASPIGQFVAPNVLSDRSPQPSLSPSPAAAAEWQRRRNL